MISLCINVILKVLQLCMVVLFGKKLILLSHFTTIVRQNESQAKLLRKVLNMREYKTTEVPLEEIAWYHSIRKDELFFVFPTHEEECKHNKT